MEPTSPVTRTPADELREAATAARKVDVNDPFWTALADWLDLEAQMLPKRGGNSPEGHTFHAMQVARAYLATTEPAVTS